REDRRSWLARGQPGTVVVKALANPFVRQRAAWAVRALSVLGGRGYPVPETLWHGELDDDWFLVVQARLPGEPLLTLDAPALDELLRLVDLQADPPLPPPKTRRVGWGSGGGNPPLPPPYLGTGGWDVSWCIGAVLFEGWE